MDALKEWNLVADAGKVKPRMTFKQFARPDFAAFSQEVEKLMREVRGNQPPITDVEATQKRYRKIQRLQQAQILARNVLSRRG